MTFFKWTDELTLGIPDIDAQHQRLFQLMSGLHDAMSQGEGISYSTKALTELAAYTDYHFRAEEQLLAKYRYPEARSHISEHRDFRRQIEGFQAKLAKGGIGVSTQLMAFLRDWLLSHIKEKDKRYASFIERSL